ncbi:MAG TPA: amidohydrolase family protein [Terracidiphilus sp.]
MSTVIPPKGPSSEVDRPTVSPDGQYVVYQLIEHSTSTWRVRDLTTGRDEALVSTETDSRVLDARFPDEPGGAFTPDGKSFVFSWRGALWCVELHTKIVTRIPFRARVNRVLAPLAHYNVPPTDATIAARQLADPAASPDGHWLAFRALNHIYVVPLTSTSGKSPGRRLTAKNESEAGPAWSPDGRFLAYTVWDDRAGGAIYRVSFHAGKAGAPERLTNEVGRYGELCYSAVNGALFSRFTAARSNGVGVVPLHSKELVRVGVGEAGFDSRSTGAYNACTEPEPDNELHEVLVRATPTAAFVTIHRSDIASATHVNSIILTLLTPPFAKPIISADGDSLALNAENGLYVLRRLHELRASTKIDLRSGRDRFKPKPGLVIYVSPERVNDAIWSPTGQVLLYVLGKKVHRYDVASGRETVQTVEINVPRDVPKGELLIRNARLITMKGDDIIENGDLLIRDDRIAGVAPTGSLLAPSGARVIDGSGLTVLPGFVTLHEHMWLFADGDPWHFEYDSPMEQLHLQPWAYTSFLSFGVTAFRTLRDDIELVTDADRADAGDLLAPRLFTAGPGALEPTEGTAEAEMTSIRRARDFVNFFSENGVETVKDRMISGEHVLRDVPRVLRRNYAVAAREKRLMVTAHDADFGASMTNLIDGYTGHEHVFSVDGLYDDAAEFIAQSGSTFTPTFTADLGAPNLGSWDPAKDPRVKRFMPAVDSERLFQARETSPELSALVTGQAARVVSFGGKVGVGTDSDIGGAGVHWEMWFMAEGGMSAERILHAATIDGAEALGEAKNFGSLEVGKRADLQVLSKNPLDDIHNTITTKYVMKNGRLYDAMTLNQVYPAARSLSRQWWQTSDCAEPSPPKFGLGLNQHK